MWIDALFYGKADMDTYVVWERCRGHLRDVEGAARAGAHLLLGYLE